MDFGRINSILNQPPYNLSLMEGTFLTLLLEPGTCSCVECVTASHRHSSKYIYQQQCCPLREEKGGSINIYVDKTKNQLIFQWIDETTALLTLTCAVSPPQQQSGSGCGGEGGACAAVSARQRWYLLLWPDSRTSRSYSGLQIHTYSAGIKIVKYVNVVDMFQGALLALLKLEIF